MRFVCCLSFMFMLFPCLIWGQHKPDIEDVSVKALRVQDSMLISIKTSAPQMQLSFLMQGMQIIIRDSAECPVISIAHPNARMVRDKIKHHPNEVKAMHKQTDEEVRPDLLPLISALNDTCCVANCYDGLPINCSHTITLDKINGGMTFAIYIVPPSFILLQNSILVEIVSSPLEMKSEFEGRRLSQENRMPPGGMGQPPIGNNDQNRIVHFTKMVQIENSNK